LTLDLIGEVRFSESTWWGRKRAVGDHFSQVAAAVSAGDGRNRQEEETAIRVRM
jgi:hypothetical protein